MLGLMVEFQLKLQVVVTKQWLLPNKKTYFSCSLMAQCALLVFT